MEYLRYEIMEISIRKFFCHLQGAKNIRNIFGKDCVMKRKFLTMFLLDLLKALRFMT